MEGGDLLKAKSFESIDEGDGKRLMMVAKVGRRWRCYLGEYWLVETKLPLGMAIEW